MASHATNSAVSPLCKPDLDWHILHSRNADMSNHSPRTFPGLFICTAGAAWLAGAGIAHAGPCTVQIAQFEKKISATPPGPETGPTFPQTLGAQLHEQPTQRDVAHAEHVASKNVEAALERAQRADDAGDSAGCSTALSEAERLYQIGQ